MPAGGKRRGAGRKRNRLTDQSLAERVLAKAQEQEKWLVLLESQNEHIRLETLKYLTDRRDGRPRQPIDGKLELDLRERRDRVSKLLTRMAGKS